MAMCNTAPAYHGCMPLCNTAPALHRAYNLKLLQEDRKAVFREHCRLDEAARLAGITEFDQQQASSRWGGQAGEGAVQQQVWGAGGSRLGG